MRYLLALPIRVIGDVLYEASLMLESAYLLVSGEDVFA